MTTNKNKPEPQSNQPDGGSTLVPMLIAGLIMVVVGYAAIMLFV